MIDETDQFRPRAGDPPSADPRRGRASAPATGAGPAGDARARPRSIDYKSEIEHLDRLAKLLDSRFSVPGTRFRFGFDSLIGLVPGVGDALTFAPQAYIVWKARQLGVPNHVIARMALNTGVDTAIGAIPLIGDLFDVAFKSNLRNMALLRDHLQKEAARASPPV